MGACAVSPIHAQQFGPNYYYPPNQPAPMYNRPPNAYPQAYPQQGVPPANMQGYPATQASMVPQQYPRIYGPLTAAPQSTPMIH